LFADTTPPQDLVANNTPPHSPEGTGVILVPETPFSEGVSATASPASVAVDVTPDAPSTPPPDVRRRLQF
jgi:hypothetical protein